MDMMFPLLAVPVTTLTNSSRVFFSRPWAVISLVMGQTEVLVTWPELVVVAGQVLGVAELG